MQGKSVAKNARATTMVITVKYWWVSSFSYRQKACTINNACNKNSIMSERAKLACITKTWLSMEVESSQLRNQALWDSSVASDVIPWYGWKSGYQLSGRTLWLQGCCTIWMKNPTCKIGPEGSTWDYCFPDAAA